MLQVKTTSDLTGRFFASPKIPSGFAGNWTDLDLDSTSSGVVFFFCGPSSGFVVQDSTYFKEMAIHHSESRWHNS